jgi:hypothetical protein
VKQFTIGYIRHNKYVYETYLGPSIDNLEGDFDVLSTTDENKPADNYNELISKCNTPYLILTHQDVTFSPNLLDRLKMTICALPDFGAIGMVGVDKQNNYFWSDSHQIYPLDTLDCCFIVIRPDDKLLFDNVTFDDYHLYVEDYCANIQRIRKKSVHTILIDSKETPITLGYDEVYKNSKSFLNHHSYTLSKRGSCWGRYGEYRQKLSQKWPGICTT